MQQISFPLHPYLVILHLISLDIPIPSFPSLSISPLPLAVTDRDCEEKSSRGERSERVLGLRAKQALGRDELHPQRHRKPATTLGGEDLRAVADAASHVRDEMGREKRWTDRLCSLLHPVEGFHQKEVEGAVAAVPLVHRGCVDTSGTPPKWLRRLASLHSKRRSEPVLRSNASYRRR